MSGRIESGQRSWRWLLAAALTATSTTGAVLDGAQAAPEPVLECNVGIPTSDGTVLKADIARPAGKGRYPMLLTVTIYGKDTGAPPGHATRREQPTPRGWCPRATPS